MKNKQQQKSRKYNIHKNNYINNNKNNKHHKHHHNDSFESVNVFTEL